MDELIKILKINVDKVKKDNLMLINKNTLEKLSKNEKYAINRYNGPPFRTIDKYGISGHEEYNLYFVNQKQFNKINIKDIKTYMSVFGINEYTRIDITDSNAVIDLLRKINTHRINGIEKCIKYINSAIEKGIRYEGKIYRIMNRPYRSNNIIGFSSWSLFPQIGFCGDSYECHLYVTKMPSKMKGLYCEYTGEDKELKKMANKNWFEHEILLPQNLDFVVLKTKIIEVSYPFFSDKNIASEPYKKQKIHIHWINFTKQNEPVKIDIKNNGSLVY